MNIFKILSNLYTNPKSDWITDLDESFIQPFVIQRWLTMNDRVRVQTRWLDKYTFWLTPKMYLSLAWSVLPKVQKTPFVKYIKKEVIGEEFDFILPKIRKQFMIADNDYKFLKPRLIEAIKKEPSSWFAYYGVPKKYWKLYYINFNLIKEFNKKEKPKAQQGLAAFGLN